MRGREDAFASANRASSTCAGRWLIEKDRRKNVRGGLGIPRESGPPR